MFLDLFKFLVLCVLDRPVLCVPTVYNSSFQSRHFRVLNGARYLCHFNRAVNFTLLLARMLPKTHDKNNNIKVINVVALLISGVERCFQTVIKGKFITVARILLYQQSVDTMQRSREGGE